MRDQIKIAVGMVTKRRNGFHDEDEDSVHSESDGDLDSEEKQLEPEGMYFKLEKTQNGFFRCSR